jgi:hypothetical protein
VGKACTPEPGNRVEGGRLEIAARTVGENLALSGLVRRMTDSQMGRGIESVLSIADRIESLDVSIPRVLRSQFRDEGKSGGLNSERYASLEPSIAGKIESLNSGNSAPPRLSIFYVNQ